MDSSKREVNLQKAFDYLRQNPDTPIKTAACMFDCNNRTLGRRYKAIKMSDLGLPITPDASNNVACNVVGQEGLQPGWKLGHEEFLERNTERQKKWGTHAEGKRIDTESDPEEIKAFQLQLSKVKRRFSVKPENIWNCDEKGFTIGTMEGQQLVITRRSLKKAAKIENNKDWEYTTIVETISAAGKVIPPYIVWQAKSHLAGYYDIELIEDDEWNDAGFVCSASGYMDNDLGRIFIEQHFEPHTRPTLRRPGGKLEPRILIVDRHSSHISWQVVDFALEHNIHIICLPSHLTHHLQPLDVGVFGILSRKYKKSYNVWLRKAGGEPMTKPVFFRILREARKETFTPDIIKSAWRCAKCWPIPFKAQDIVAAAEARKEALKGVQDTPAKLRDLERRAVNAIRSVTGDSDALKAFQQYALVTSAYIRRQWNLRNNAIPCITRSGRSLEPGRRKKRCSNMGYANKQKTMVEGRVAKKQEAEQKRIEKEIAQMNAAVEHELARRLDELNFGGPLKAGKRKRSDMKKK